MDRGPDPAGGGGGGALALSGGDRGPDPAGGGGMARTLEAGERTSAPAPAGGAAVGRDMQDVVPESRRVPAAAAAVAMCGTSSTTATMPVSGASGRDTPTGVPTPEKV